MNAAKRRLQCFWAVIAAVFAVLGTVDLRRMLGDGELTAIFFDVGQGDAAAFVFPDSTVMLVDAGTRASADTLAAKLIAAGIPRADIFVATHPHDDHIGGADRIITLTRVSELWENDSVDNGSHRARMLDAAASVGALRRTVRAGWRADIGGAEVSVLAPKSRIETSENDNCLIIRVAYGGASFLMMADAEREERETVGTFPPSTVIKLAHHGSVNGTDDDLLSQTSPRWAVISYGAGNTHGHPHDDVSRLIEAHGIEALRTPDGDITFRTDGRTIEAAQ